MGNSKKIIFIRALPLICILAVTAVVVLVWLGRNDALAWFSSNKQVSGSGMQVTVSDDALEFTGPIKVQASIGDTETEAVRYYWPHKNGAYYEVTDTNTGNLETAGEIDGKTYYYEVDKDGSFIPIDLTGLFPNETITMTVSFHNRTKAPVNYQLTLQDFDDSNGTFKIEENTSADSKYDAGTYSIMGIFKVTMDDITAGYGKAGANSGSYLADFNTMEGKSDVTAVPFVIADGTLPANSDTVTCTFTIQIDLTEYYKLNGIMANMLSKKSLKIGSLKLYVVD